MTPPIHIVSHGRPECKTYAMLMRIGYRGEVRIVVDDEDAALPEYVARYGEVVRVFDRSAEEAAADLMDAFGSSVSTGVVPARNASMRIAREEGHDRLWQFDDDFDGFVRRDADGNDRDVTDGGELGALLGEMDELARRTDTPAMGCGVAHYANRSGARIGHSIACAMNLKTDGSVTFRGRLFEDTVTTVDLTRTGHWCYCTNALLVRQRPWYCGTRDGDSFDTGGLLEHYETVGGGRDRDLNAIKLSGYLVMALPAAGTMRIRPKLGNHVPVRVYELVPKLLRDKWAKE